VSLFVWLLPVDLSGKGDPTSSYATAGIALQVKEARKLPHHDKVETPLGEKSSSQTPLIALPFSRSLRYLLFSHTRAHQHKRKLFSATLRQRLISRVLY
jgi:hypothetical protein